VPSRRRRPATAATPVRRSVRQNKIRIRHADINLLSVTRSDSAALRDALKSAGVPAVEIGEVLPQGKPLIEVV